MSGPVLTKILVMSDNGQFFMQDEYAISDRDEMEGDEHEDAVKRV